MGTINLIAFCALRFDLDINVPAPQAVDASFVLGIGDGRSEEIVDAPALLAYSDID